MGRGKIEIKKIENANSRQVTFSKRRSGLFKKANELAVLCDADIALIIFSNTGKLFDFCSSSMKNILARYKKFMDASKDPPALEYKPEKQETEEPQEADVLKEEIEKLQSKLKDLTDLSLLELSALEHQLNERLICVKQRKEQLLMQQLEQYKVQEQRVVLENETLRKQVEELQGFFPTTSSPTMFCIDYHSTLKNPDPAIKEGSGSPEMACNGRLPDDGESDTALQLGPPSMIYRKRKTPDAENHSST